ncbi:MAG: efflux RND transporter periplasmic adaptor subunit [Deltaproteobacteria bacterium]|nr:efflux RND transporter periplasmic adaptor subunit [Deltaproteobacteria bacterium]
MTTSPVPDVARVLGLGRGARTWRSVKRYGIWALALVLVLGVARAIVRGGGPAAPPRYVTAPITRGDLRVTVTATGTLHAPTAVDVGAEVSGRLIKVNVDYNDRVTKGQVLAVIDPEQLRAAVAQAEAQVAVADAAVRQAVVTATEQRQIAERTARLGAQQLIATQEVESAEAARARADAAVGSARANRTLAVAQATQARSKLAKATITSPIDGIVLAREVALGQTVTAGFTTPVLFELAEDLGHLTLNVDIDEADIGRVREGNAVTFTVDAYPGRTFASTVVQLRNHATVTQHVVTYEAVLAVDNREHLLRPGMTATALIVTEIRTDVRMVPNAALRFEPTGATAAAPGPAATRAGAAAKRVWRLEGGAVIATSLTTGVTDGTSTEVTSDAPAAGTAVIVDVEDAP